MKTSITLFFLFFVLLVNAQYKDWTEAKVYLKNGTMLDGRARLTMLEGRHEELFLFGLAKEYLRFIQGKQRKSDKFEGQEVDSVVFKLKGNPAKKNVTFIPILKNGERKKYGFAELFIDGKVKLVKRTVSSTNYGKTFKESLLVRKGEEAILFNYAELKSFKKSATEYFKDCPSLVSKINDTKYRRKDLEDLVKFYNINCAK